MRVCTKGALVSPVAKKYMSTQLLIIDEIGYEIIDREEASLFFRIVSHRYLRGSIILTTNKSVKDWPETLAGEEVMTTAVLDRTTTNQKAKEISLNLRRSIVKDHVR